MGMCVSALTALIETVYPCHNVGHNFYGSHFAIYDALRQGTSVPGCMGQDAVNTPTIAMTVAYASHDILQGVAILTILKILLN